MVNSREICSFYHFNTDSTSFDTKFQLCKSFLIIELF